MSQENIVELPKETADNHPTDLLVAQLKDIVGTASREATFACGGTIPIRADHSGVGATQETDGTTLASTTIALRWDAPTGGSNTGRKLTFPVAADDEPCLKQLVNDCSPATFGLNNKDVLDLQYRRAGKMDPEAFSTTFNPYDLGIIDTISQMLLPSALSTPKRGNATIADIMEANELDDECDSEDENMGFDVYDGADSKGDSINFDLGDDSKSSKINRGVRAELYKLNIYSALCGRFKAHVDTPRSERQFGSLVVCLPAPHQGGQLAVRHNGREVIFDWGSQRGDDKYASIRWAAFYSDCEHEVLDVTAGNRVTLTYNLYVSRTNGLLTGMAPPALDATQLPLYHPMKQILADKKFMETGGKLGFFCTHEYPHTSKTHALFPEMLKGADMAIWETLAKLNVPASIQSIIMPTDDDVEGYLTWKDEEKQQEREGVSPISLYEASDAYDKPPFAWLSKNLAFQPLERCFYDGDVTEFRDEWAETGDGADFKSIRWLTPVPGLNRRWQSRPAPGEEIQHTHAVYGNEPNADWTYSRCCIIAEVPAAALRALEEASKA